MRRFYLRWVFASFLVGAAPTAQAQILVTDEIRQAYHPPGNADIAGLPPSTGVPEGGYGYGDGAVGPSDIVRIVRLTGYEPLGPPVRRRWVYTISAINPGGDDGRVVLDARTGRIIGFVPADVSDDDVVGSYGPPGLPPPLPPKTKVRTSLRPPLPIPHVANRAPAVTAGKPDPHMARAVPSAAQSASTQTKPADVKPVESQPVEAKPTIQLQPTRDMPAVQGAE